MLNKKINTWARWIHIYLSMFSFSALLLFSITGITMNHPLWIADKQKVVMFEGELDTAWVVGSDTSSIEKSQIVEYLRDLYKIRARLTEFRVEENECSLSFNGPGYTAYGSINRSSGSYELMVTKAGFIAVLNDLHRGSDTGEKWSAVIDISAIFLIVISVTGFIMIFFMTKRKTKYLWVAVTGAITFTLLCLIFV